MTQEDKELLLKDLSARLPYGVKCEIDDLDEPLELDSIKYKGDYFIFGNGVYERYITEIKPYLRPISSMTEEERKEYNDIVKNTIDFYNCPKSEEICFFIIPIDWLNAHHFDYRGLINKGLALEASKGMYNIKEK